MEENIVSAPVVPPVSKIPSWFWILFLVFGILTGLIGYLIGKKSQIVLTPPIGSFGSPAPSPIVMEKESTSARYSASFLERFIKLSKEFDDFPTVDNRYYKSYIIGKNKEHIDANWATINFDYKVVNNQILRKRLDKYLEGGISIKDYPFDVVYDLDGINCELSKSGKDLINEENLTRLEIICFELSE